jgi:hypothetical protein
MSAFDTWIGHKDVCTKCYSENNLRYHLTLHLCPVGQRLYDLWNREAAINEAKERLVQAQKTEPR